MIERVTPDELNHYKRFYEVDGFVKIPSFFHKDEIDGLRAAAMRCYREAEDHQIQWCQGDFPALLFWPGKKLNRWVNEIAPVVRYLLGDDVLQLNNQYYFRLPGDGDQFAWHQDISFRIPKKNFKQIETGYLQTAIVVDEMGPHNGGIEFIEGSHLIGELELVPRDGTEQGLRNYGPDGRPPGDMYCAIAKPGDLLLWSVMVVHGSQPNQSNYSRGYFMNGFARESCIIDNDEFPHYLKGGELCNQSTR